MGQAVLRVDFQNKKLIPNQQNNSDFYKNKHLLCDGEVTIFTTSNSGGKCVCVLKGIGNTFKKV